MCSTGTTEYFSMHRMFLCRFLHFHQNFPHNLCLCNGIQIFTTHFPPILTKVPAFLIPKNKSSFHGVLKNTKHVDQVVQCLSSQTSPFYNLYIYIYILVIQLSVLFIKRVHFICHSYKKINTQPSHIPCCAVFIAAAAAVVCVYVCLFVQVICNRYVFHTPKTKYLFNIKFSLSLPPDNNNNNNQKVNCKNKCI